MILIVGRHMFCANVGDSRAALSRNGTAWNLSYDHKPQRPDEIERIKKNDGVIEFGRVGAKLAITRAFGDFEFKIQIEDGNEVRKNYITSEPEIRRFDLDIFEDEFIVMGSDGLFDKFKSQEACDFIRTHIEQYNFLEDNMENIAKQIAYESIFTHLQRDNTTVLIIKFNLFTEKLKNLPKKP
uniref:PPM-type phosphatase domain-containing protein n=1 Tax=Strombidium inclinatum TaxID=197538 RepID=A0A7S3IWR6_9SPIT|mmetsp:Transcript_4396/g.6381  ORF Transcript_4396/g.6381 Transcript_4396/m.6381 type:complete len:183 (+) Transcript_4396:1728-2276(+)